MFPCDDVSMEAISMPIVTLIIWFARLHFTFVLIDCLKIGLTSSLQIFRDVELECLVLARVIVWSVLVLRIPVLGLIVYIYVGILKNTVAVKAMTVLSYFHHDNGEKVCIVFFKTPIPASVGMVNYPFYLNMKHLVYTWTFTTKWPLVVWCHYRSRCRYCPDISDGRIIKFYEKHGKIASADYSCDFNKTMFSGQFDSCCGNKDKWDGTKWSICNHYTIVDGQVRIAPGKYSANKIS